MNASPPSSIPVMALVPEEPPVGSRAVPSAASQRDILVVTRTFLPDAGGIQEYAYNRCLQDSDRIIVLTAACLGDQAFDQQQPFPVYRWPAADFCRNWGGFGQVLKQILYMGWAFYWALKLFRHYRFRSIEWGHGYDFPVVLLLSYLLPIQFFLYLHGDDLLCPTKNVLFRHVFQLTLNRATAIACNSRFTETALKQQFVLHCPSWVIHPTVRPGKFGQSAKPAQSATLRQQVRDQYGIPEQAVVIFSVGRLVRRKGFDRLIQQLPALVAAGLDVYYLIAGQGAMAAELAQIATELGVTGRTIFAGYIPDEQLGSLYAASDIFAMLTFFDASANSIEGFGIVYLEAGYFGKPVLATNVGGVADAVQNGETGILVEPDAEAELLQALHQLCQDPDLRQRLGRAGQERALRFTPHRCLYGLYAPAT